MDLFISPEIFIDILQLLLTPADISNLKCVNRYWMGVVMSIEKQREEQVKSIVDNGSSKIWRKSNFLRLRSIMVPKYSVICSKYLCIYKIVDHIHLSTPRGNIVGFIDENNIVYRSHSHWAQLYDAILLVFDSLPPVTTLGHFCTHCPFCGKSKTIICTCAFKWARWFNTLLPKRVCINRTVFKRSEDLSLFCDCHVLMDDCNESNCNH